MKANQSYHSHCIITAVSIIYTEHQWTTNYTQQIKKLKTKFVLALPRHGHSKIKQATNIIGSESLGT